jgi:hypothetical protein
MSRHVRITSALAHRHVALAGAAALAVAAAGCGSGSASVASAPAKPASTAAPEVSPSGDIPDNQAYVPYAVPGAGLTVKTPEGWSRSSAGGAVTFTDKLNAIRVETKAAGAPLTVPGAKQTEVPKLAASVPGYQAGTVSVVTRKAGAGLRITYLADAKADPVTGKAGKRAVERYIFFHRGKNAILTLSGPKGADNVDPWKIVTDSLTWSR